MGHHTAETYSKIGTIRDGYNNFFHLEDVEKGKFLLRKKLFLILGRRIETKHQLVGFVFATETDNFTLCRVKVKCHEHNGKLCHHAHY